MRLRSTCVVLRRAIRRIYSNLTTQYKAAERERPVPCPLRKLQLSDQALRSGKSLFCHRFVHNKFMHAQFPPTPLFHLGSETRPCLVWCSPPRRFPVLCQLAKGSTRNIRIPEGLLGIRGCLACLHTRGCRPSTPCRSHLPLSRFSAPCSQSVRFDHRQKLRERLDLLSPSLLLQSVQLCCQQDPRPLDDRKTEQTGGVIDLAVSCFNTNDHI